MKQGQTGKAGLLCGAAFILVGAVLWQKDVRTPTSMCRGQVTAVSAVGTKDGDRPFVRINCADGRTLAAQLRMAMTDTAVQEIIANIDDARRAGEEVTAWTHGPEDVLVGLRVGAETIKDPEATVRRKRAFGPTIAMLGGLAAVISAMGLMIRRRREGGGK